MNTFKRLGQKSLKKIIRFLVEMMTPKSRFEINWPIVTEAKYYSTILKEWWNDWKHEDGADNSSVAAAAAKAPKALSGVFAYDSQYI